LESSRTYTAVLLPSEYPPTPEVEASIREEARAALAERNLDIESEGEWQFSGPEEDDEDEEEGLYMKLFRGRPR
jgi:hypothetical protein